LPTSLTYITPPTRGCSPWRPAAVVGTARGTDQPRARIFKGRAGGVWAPRIGAPSGRGAPLLQPSCFRGPPPALRRDENSPRAPARRLRATLASPPGLLTGGRISTAFSFRWCAEPRGPRGPRHRAPFHTHPTQPSEPTHWWRTPLPTKPFHHFSLLGSHKNRCYFHQDLHWGRFQAGPRRTLPHHPHARLLVGPHPPAQPPSTGGPLQRHPFSGLVHSAGKLLHTSWRISTSRTTVLLSS